VYFVTHSVDEILSLPIREYKISSFHGKGRSSSRLIPHMAHIPPLCQNLLVVAN
jgi:hypothetical protein